MFGVLEKYFECRLYVYYIVEFSFKGYFLIGNNYGCYMSYCVLRFLIVSLWVEWV